MAAAEACAASLAACEASLQAHFAPAMQECAQGGSVWLFGFASLMWRTDNMTPTRAEHAALGGWVRRFWQASPDHRGAPEHMGRVATIVPVAAPAAAPPPPPAQPATPTSACPLTVAALQQWCQDSAAAAAAASPALLAAAALEVGEDPVVHGMAYCLTGATACAHLASLCKREAGGYVAHRVKCVLKGGEVVDAHTFVGPADGEFYRPGAPAELAAIICTAKGASGDNLDYLVLCQRALLQLGVQDVALDALVALALALKAGGG